MNLPNWRTKLIWTPTTPWTLYVDDQSIGEWLDCRPWERGIEGRVGTEWCRIDVVVSNEKAARR